MVSIRQVLDPITTITSSGSLTRFSPEPKSSLPFSFSSILSGVGSLLSKAGGAFPGLGSNYSDLIQLQMHVQEQMMLMSTYSNIEKSKHETQMAAVRNIRVG